ncbi:neuroplastin-like isoform X1 [Biomphalaria glabrata]|uniref:Ig-like domain-containing protein n=2 Tax=Biomphalaria glabrata TaxID=6526 RepID=A0A2C9LAX8_BIOGL|nr:neuroplastin-like isoform X1 [Biomphalaria glabrata]
MQFYFCIFFLLSWSYATDIITSNSEHELQLFPPYRNAAVGIGDKAVFDCSIDPRNGGTPAWKTKTGGNVQVTNQDFTSRLEFLHFAVHNVGTYLCELAKGNVQQEQLYLSIVGVDVHKSSSVFEYEMESATLECKITPIKSIITSAFEGWYYDQNSTEIMLSGDNFITTNGKLVIKDPRRIDSGIYSARFNLNNENTKIVYNCQVPLKASPLVLNLPRSISYFMDNDANITCMVLGYPMSTVTWTFEDRELQLSNRYLLSDIGGNKNNRLTILKVKYSDRGTYNCTASNGIGFTSSKVILLRVRDPFEWLYPLVGLIIEVVVVGIIVIICARKERRRLEEITPKKK